MPPEPALLLHLAERLTQAVAHETSRFLEGYAVTRLDCAILTALPVDDQNPPPKVTELATYCGIQQPTVTKALDRLVARGMATRKRCPIDRRVVEVRLTPTGRRLAAELRQRCHKAENEALKRLQATGDVASLVSRVA